MWIVTRYAAMSLLLVACASQDQESAEKKPAAEGETMQLVARVQSQPGNKDFVLLEAYGKWTLDEGVILHSYGIDGRSATLETSGEKLGQFVAADVKSGEVSVGDAVYHRTKGSAQAPAVGPQGSPDPPNKPAAMPPAAVETAPVPAIEPVPLPSN